MTASGIHPHNQPPALADYNLYTSDPVLRGAVQRAGAGWREAELARQGAEYGAADTLQAAADANRFTPELQAFSATGERIDQVRFHPAWHQMMALARRNGIANLPYFDCAPRPGVWAAYGASLFMHSQVEAGSACPTTMTKACIPLLRRNAPLYAVAQASLASLEHDPRDLPLAAKRSIAVGMGMTEKQGGSDLRGTTTTALRQGEGPWGEEFRINGHKWFFSAPMCDGHLVLARTAEQGPSCFFVPRWHPDGGKNPVYLLRLKDKVGNRSNSSSEVEFHDAWGVRVGEAGRGIATLIEMATFTRLDCALSSAGFMRQAFAQALHHSRNRFAFGKALAEQPLMQQLLADMALESEAATLLAMDLAARFASEAPLDRAWCRLLTPAAKFWNCKRAVAITAEAMEVLGGNGYVESGPMGRLFREAPVNSIWEGSGNVMCLDLLRAVARHPDDAQLLLAHLAEQAAQAQAPALAAQVRDLHALLRPPPELWTPQARRITQKLVLAVQAGLMLRHAHPEAADAFLQSRFDPDWGPVAGIGPGDGLGNGRPAALLGAAWTA